MELIFGLVVLALDIWAIVNVLNSRASGGSKAAWTLGIVFFPLLGFLAWYFAGPRGGTRAVA